MNYLSRSFRGGGGWGKKKRKRTTKRKSSLFKFREKRKREDWTSLCGNRQRPMLPGGFPPSTFSVLRLNYCVRDGNRWDPQAIVTGNCIRLCSLQESLRPPLSLPLALRFSSFRFHTFKTAQALRLSPSLHWLLTLNQFSRNLSLPNLFFQIKPSTY